MGTDVFLASAIADNVQGCRLALQGKGLTRSIAALFLPQRVARKKALFFNA